MRLVFRSFYATREPAAWIANRSALTGAVVADTPVGRPTCYREARTMKQASRLCCLAIAFGVTVLSPLGATYAFMDQSREGREMWRYMQMSSHDFLCQLFEHDKVRMHFAHNTMRTLFPPSKTLTV